MRGYWKNVHLGILIFGLFRHVALPAVNLLRGSYDCRHLKVHPVHYNLFMLIPLKVDHLRTRLITFSIVTRPTWSSGWLARLVICLLISGVAAQIVLVDIIIVIILE